MKRFFAGVMIMATLTSTSLVQARDTDEARNALLKARESIDAALALLKQTRFSEAQTIKDPKDCVSESIDPRVKDAAISVKSLALAKCGADCSVSISYEEGVYGYYSYPTCVVTAVATKK